MTVDPKNTPTVDLHQFILASASPRPIAFASTISPDGVANLAPYSFFNAFSSNPPILVFSSNRRVEDNTTKDTLHNIRETGEVVINVVSHSILRQMALTSCNYPKDVSEFEKGGFTPLPSLTVKPFRVKESPVNMECKVKEIITLGEDGGAGHLIICNVTMIHIDDEVIDARGRIDPHKLDLVGRMGRLWYVRASGNALFELNQPVTPLAIGFDSLPEHIRHHALLTGNEIAQIAALTALPTESESLAYLSENEDLIALKKEFSGDELKNKIALLARQLLAENKAKEAASLLSDE